MVLGGVYCAEKDWMSTVDKRVLDFGLVKSTRRLF